MAANTHVLSTVARIKTRLGISVSTYDTVLADLLNEATDFVETFCQRRFLRTTYTNEVYDGGDGGRETLYLRQAPVTSLSAFSERTGTISTPAWTAVNADLYELADGGRTGIVNLGFRLTGGTGNYRVTYVAGYLIDFSTEGTIATHNLPADLTSACEQLVAQMYTSRASSGIASESLGSHSVTYSDLIRMKSGELNSIGLILSRYVRPNYL